MSRLPEIPIDHFNYLLPESQIAQQAAEPRDSSKLMVYRHGLMETSVFRELPEFLDHTHTLIFNNAKVIPARLFLNNSNGAKIEVFLLQPFQADHTTALSSTSEITWECLVGNSKKWKETEVLHIEIDGEMVKLLRIGANLVTIQWASGRLFSELLEQIGKIPLPPYIRHTADDEDAKRYQTIYSKIAGSVAAPTAGLHFTDRVMDNLKAKGVSTSFVTLHVGAGTFMPVKTDNAAEHPMHKEFFEIDLTLLNGLLADFEAGKKMIAVGTTSCRVLESLYYVAMQIKCGSDQPLSVPQFPYLEEEEPMPMSEVLGLLKAYLEVSGEAILKGDTSIMITPGYRFKFCKGIITNFHQPKSTLLLLISAFIGDKWRQVYEKALSEGYRFLSYGDSSILLP